MPPNIWSVSGIDPIVTTSCITLLMPLALNVIPDRPCYSIPILPASDEPESTAPNAALLFVVHTVSRHGTAFQHAHSEDRRLRMKEVMRPITTKPKFSLPHRYRFKPPTSICGFADSLELPPLDSRPRTPPMVPRITQAAR